MKFQVVQSLILNLTSWSQFLTYRDGSYHFGNGKGHTFFLAWNRMDTGTGTGSGNALKLPYFWTTFGLTWQYNNWSPEPLGSFTSSFPNHTTPYGGLGRCIWSLFWPIFDPRFKENCLNNWKWIKIHHNITLISWRLYLTYRDGTGHFGNGKGRIFYLARNRKYAGTGIKFQKSEKKSFFGPGFRRFLSILSMLQ